MSFSLFKQKGARTPEEVVRHTKGALLAWAELQEHPPDAEVKALEKTFEELPRSLDALKATLSSEGSADGSADLVAEAACKEGLVDVLLTTLVHLDFQGRKAAAAIFGGLLRQNATPQYLEQHPHLLDQLIGGQILSLPSFFRFFEYAQSPSFEISCDAFTTFKELLTRHNEVTYDFLVAHYTEFFEPYRSFLVSDNYVTKRQSLKFLGELLLARAHVAVLVRYIADVQNLRLLMILLKDPSKSIQFEAFHVFKVFVVNPNKEPPILSLLCKNKHKLLAYLEDFQQDKEDEQFEEEKALLVKEIQHLPEPSHRTPSDRSAAVD